MGLIGEIMDFIKNLPIMTTLFQAIDLGMLVTHLLMASKVLICVTGISLPVVIVLSGSMEPGFKRGDILLLHMTKDPIRAGEIVLFEVDGENIPITHRVIRVHERQANGEVVILTKGDKNFGDDRSLYPYGQLWLQRHHIIGRAVGLLPYFGWWRIIIIEKPIVQYISFGVFGLLYMIER